jgi:hypothetical protein
MRSRISATESGVTRAALRPRRRAPAHTRRGRELVQRHPRADPPNRKQSLKKPQNLRVTQKLGDDLETASSPALRRLR